MEAHRQLKAIRAELGMTQLAFAAMLGVNYQYFVSMETGQRPLSRPLASKLAVALGVVKITDKNTEPQMHGTDGQLISFTKDRYLNYKTSWPAFFIDGECITPPLADYVRCAEALLLEAERPVVDDFVHWFTRNATPELMKKSGLESNTFFRVCIAKQS